MGLKLLIIDDDEFDRKSIVRALHGSSPSVDFLQASTAKMGLEIAKSTKLDLILLDYVLPDSNGLNTLKEIRDLKSEQTAIVMLSHQDDEKLSEEAILFGAQDFLRKDEVRPERLKRVIHQARHRYQLEATLLETQHELRKQAELDALTGLANRYMLNRVLQSSVKSAQRKGTLALMLLDLDHFKEVNDTFGHLVGDKLLIQVTQRLNSVVRDSDLLARIGGDEFVIVVNDMESEEKAALLVKRIFNVLMQPFDLGAIEWKITCSIGIATLGSLVSDSSGLLKCADIAMYRAKEDGRNQCHFYSENLHSIVMRRMELAKELETAIELEQLEVCYQPQIDTKTRRIKGAEALLRWNHPKLGLLLPGDFLDIAEETGLMPQIGKWVLEVSCAQLSLWKKTKNVEFLDFIISVNLSSIQFDNIDLIDTISNTIKKYDLDPSSLELEITENIVIENTDKVAVILSEISDLGVKLSLDDFGTGYSSFNHLKLFPINSLKIDRSFMGVDKLLESDKHLLSAIVKFGHALDLKVIAEGVETEEQVQFCQSLNCDLLQGFFFDRALKSNDFEEKYFNV